MKKGVAMTIRMMAWR